ncbi:hypothetical protein SAMN03159288_03381 [Rhizobium sp. NFACC06-2]|nr:hypothetical protein SAMN03159288_03381 [Rhizobium sp. NFACC06-2]
MELSNRSWGVKMKIAAGCMVVFAIDIRRRTIEATQHEPSMWTAHSTETAMHPINGMARLTSRQGRFKHSRIG